MKEISELKLPEELMYSDDHEWAKQTGATVKIGITDYAQDQLGDIVFVEMPEVGETFAAGDEFGSLESVKAVSEAFIPLGGEVVAVNEELEEAPELVNEDPYTSWIVEIKPSGPEEYAKLMDREKYIQLLKG